MTPIESFLAAVKAKHPTRPHDALDDILEQLTPHELASIYHAWRELWARPEQIFPEKFRMRTFLGARRSGKTRAVCEWAQEEVLKYPHARIILLAQTEDKARDVLVLGDGGLIATAPPWNPARWEPSSFKVFWANGAWAKILSPGEPHNIRGDGWTHAVFTELQSWPRNTRAEALMNMHIAVSATPRKIAGDCTPPHRGRNPLLDSLLADAAADPDDYIVVHTKMGDNRNNLGEGHEEDLRKRYQGAAARAELDGIYDPHVDGALFDQEWIDDARRHPPDVYVRRIIVIDPAIGTREESDSTGMVELGLGKDDQIYVIDDLSGKHEAHVWAGLAIDRYVDRRCDCILVEMNRGGNLGTQNLRAEAAKRGLRVEVVKPTHAYRHVPGVVHVKEVNAKGTKAERAAPVATLYEAGKVSHVRGAVLADLEKLMTEWVPPEDGTRGGGRRSPDAMDAMVHGVVELAGLNKGGRFHPPIVNVVQQLPGPPRAGSVSDLRERFRRDRWGSTI